MSGEYTEDLHRHYLKLLRAEVDMSADDFDGGRGRWALHTIESLEKENAALREAQRWIPVGERLPKICPSLQDDPEWALVVRDGEVEIEATYRTERLAENGWRWDGYNEEQSLDVTHWVPLPPPPTTDKGE